VRWRIVQWLSLAVMITVSQAKPLASQQHWRLVEDLRIGGAEDGPTSFNEIRDFAVDINGRIFVHDYKTQEIRLFDRTGKFLRLVGRSGAGPGEFNEPNGIALAPDGSLWVNDYNNARFDIFKGDGTFARQMLVPGWGYGWRWGATFDHQGRLMEVIPIRPTATTPRSSGVRRFDPKSARWDTLKLPTCFPSKSGAGNYSWSYRTPSGGGIISIPFAPTITYQVNPSGAAWCGSGTEYHIVQLELGTGRTLTDIIRPIAPVPIPAAARDSTIASLRERATKLPPGTIDLSMVPHDYPIFSAFTVDDQDQLWAFRRSPGSSIAIDVWTRSGIQVGTLGLPPGVQVWLPKVIRGNTFYGLILDDDGVPFVVRYRVEK
jgi:hypothetical protein